MDILQLQYFQTIARLENISKASELLYVAQPNLSVSIKRLEEDLGVALFDRRRGKIKLTPAGRLFLGYVDDILAHLDEGVFAARQSQKQSDERVRVASIIVDLMGNLLNEYLPSHANVSFQQLNCRNSEVADRVLRGEADLGFIFGAVPRQGLEYIEIDACERVVQLSKTHPLAERKIISLSELDGQRLICNLARDDEEVIRELSHTRLPHPNVFYTCDDNRVEIGMMTRGGGVSIAPLSNYLKLISGAPELDITYLRIREPLPPARLGMIRRSGDHLSSAALQFYEMVYRFFLHEREIAQRFEATMPPR